MNSLSVNLPTVVTAVVLLLGTIFTGIFARNNRKATSKQSREPSWVELATENRALRADLDTLQDKFDEFRNDMETWRTSMNQKVDAYNNVIDDISRQTPKDFTPLLNPSDVAILKDTLPKQWVMTHLDTSTA